eukprot:5656236-Amphidinium_carterae.1
MTAEKRKKMATQRKRDTPKSKTTSQETSHLQWDEPWDPWSKARHNKGGSSTSWWMDDRQDHPDPKRANAEAWASYKPPARPVTNADNTKVEALEQRVANIEKAQATGNEHLLKMDTRMGTVERDITGLSSQMQINFDRLFQKFEERNADGEQARKHPRMEDLRGGMPSRVGEMDIDHLASMPGFHIAAVNPCSHKGHLDRMLDKAFDVIVLSESNHTMLDLCEARYVPTSDDSLLKYNMAWTHPPRKVGDQLTPGRPSAGLVIAAQKFTCKHPFETQMVRDMDLAGRLILRRLEFSPGLWINLWGIYAPVVGWKNAIDVSTHFLLQAFEEILAHPNEMSLVIGDFNVEFSQDIVTQAAQARGLLLDIGQVLLSPDEVLPTTYRTRSGASTIDRALCTPSLLRFVKAHTVCTGAATGSHLPLVITLQAQHEKVPPVLMDVLQLPPRTKPLDPVKVTRWQLVNGAKMDRFREDLDHLNISHAYFLWASLWEEYLQCTNDEALHWVRYTGRATAKMAFYVPVKSRCKTQMHTEAEAKLWKMLGTLQGHRQGRHSVTAKARATASRLHDELARTRTLPVLAWDDLVACKALEEAVTRAIQAERWRRIATRKTAWRTELNLANGYNKAARRMVRGASPRLHMLTTDTDAFTCPRMQCKQLLSDWSPIMQGVADRPVHPDVWAHVVRAPCELPSMVAQDVSDQLARTKINTAAGPDWWRTSELRQLPAAAHSVLAS